MTRATFTERLRAHDLLWRWIFAAVCLLLLLAGTAGPQVAHALLEPWLGPGKGPEEWRVGALAGAVVSCLMVVGVALLVVALLRWGGRWTTRKYGLLCPSCGAALAGRYRHAALGAGTCGSCQARVVEDPPSPLGVPLPSRAEFLALLGEYRAAWQRQARPYLRAVCLCFLPGALAVWPFAAWVEPSLRLRPARLHGRRLSRAPADRGPAARSRAQSLPRPPSRPARKRK
jgi:hypothetical protein